MSELSTNKKSLVKLLQPAMLILMILSVIALPIYFLTKPQKPKPMDGTTYWIQCNQPTTEEAGDHITDFIKKTCPDQKGDWIEKTGKCVGHNSQFSEKCPKYVIICDFKYTCGGSND